MKGIFGRKVHNNEKKKVSGKVFGVPLIDVCTRENQNIPHIVEETVEYLESKGLEVEGIFRIPGNDTIIQKLKNYYNGEEGDQITLETCEDVYAVAGLLKLYLRELSEPLFTHRFYENFISIQKNPDLNYRYSNFKKLISALPSAHKHTLQYLFSFFVKIPKFSEKNKMGEANLAIVLGPNLLRPRQESMLRMIEDARHVNAIIELFLREYEYFILQTTSTLKEADFSKSDKSKSSDGHGSTIMEGSNLDLVDFDLENPLIFAQQKLATLQTIKSSQDLSDFPLSLVRTEKMLIKIQLRNFENAFKLKMGYPPSAADKQCLRLFYQFYQLLSQNISKRQLKQFEEEMSAVIKKIEEENVKSLPGLYENIHFKLLVKEKRKLQFSIHQYQAKFSIINGRKISSLADRLPIHLDYVRYKELKRIIEKIKNNYEMLSPLPSLSLPENVGNLPRMNYSMSPLSSNSYRNPEVDEKADEKKEAEEKEKNSTDGNENNNNNGCNDKVENNSLFKYL